ncbi:hypothetical protein [Bradyrhizobium sp. Leo121]|uniref:hypothetical protein n=1 Tax=Bradyrhizobium sp. Leo121 TaxID=1571195 RepID=UPI001028DB9B|nr:hypothetical protein [Bradyrhizobium sp. Leo121]
MKKSILVGLAILTVSTSAASAWTHQSYRNSHRPHYGSAYGATRAAQSEAMTNRAYNAYNNGYYGPGYARSGFWPADAAGAAIGTAGAVAAGAVNTAGAIATAPFRPATSYGYYPANSYAMAPGGVSSKDHAQYMKNLRDSGYDRKNDFNANGTVKTQ